MSWTTIIQLGLALGIFLYVFDTWKKAKFMKAQMKKFRDDNIEWMGDDIRLKRKKYEDQQMKDDFRESVEEPTTKE